MPVQNNNVTGVNYFAHLIRSLFAPYGKTLAFDSEQFFRSLKGWKCELLRRPAVGISELIVTVHENKEFVEVFWEDVISEVVQLIPPDGKDGFRSCDEMKKIYYGKVNLFLNFHRK